MNVVMSPKYAKFKQGDKVYFIPTPAMKTINLKNFEVYAANVYQVAAKVDNGAVIGLAYMLEVNRGYDTQYLVTTGEHIFKNEYDAGLYAIGCSNIAKRDITVKM